MLVAIHTHVTATVSQQTTDIVALSPALPAGTSNMRSQLSSFDSPTGFLTRWGVLLVATLTFLTHYERIKSPPPRQKHRYLQLVYFRLLRRFRDDTDTVFGNSSMLRRKCGNDTDTMLHALYSSPHIIRVIK